MKKLFLIPLMALMCSVMAWGTTIIKVGGEGATYSADLAGFNSAIAAATAEDVILLQEDINYGNLTTSQRSSSVNIKKSVTIDGGNHTLTGSSFRPDKSNNNATIWINQSGSQMVDVTIRNLTIINERTENFTGDSYSVYRHKGIETRGKIGNIVLENVNIIAKSAALQIGGDHTGQAEMTNVNLTNCSLTTIWDPADENSGVSYYPVMLYNAINLTMNNCETKGWAAIYFKPADSSIGSYGSNVVATDCRFDAQNNNSGASNSFGAFVLEDDGINITLDNCYVNATSNTEQDQAIFCLSDWKAILQANMHLAPCEFTVRGASTEFLGNILTNSWKSTIAECPITFFFYGGTYNDNIEEKIGEGIPTGWHVNALPTVKGGEEIILYRVVKDAATHEVTDPEDPSQKIEVLYDLNANVEGEGNGENPVTSFDLSTGTEMELNQTTTNAGYVQVSDNGSNATIIKVGKVENPGTPSETVVDQKLVIGEGLDVQGESQVVVQAGSTLQIGEGGITTEDPENIVIEANENGAASLLLDPEVIVNNTPELTIKMKAKQIGRRADGQFMWHRYAMPVAHIENWEKKGSLVAENPSEYGAVQYPTYIYGWDYANNDWANIAVNEMVPLQGYTLTLASDYIHVDGTTGEVESEGTAGGNLNILQDVTYIFKGNLVGNTNQPLNFQAEGFNFFGNSYTGYIDVLTLINGFASENVEGTVYMWCNDPDDDEGRYQSYVGVPLFTLQTPALSWTLEDWQKEVAPMQTFILRLRGADSADENVDYASAIWGNPRYGNNTASPAPRRVVATNNIESHMAIVVKANGKGSRVEFTQDANYTDAFENGCDVVKYMNENTINLYATVNGEDLSSVVTNSLNGKLLSLQTNDEVNYTMSFKNVAGTEYAILDHATNQMTVIAEGNTYQFAAQPNSTVEGRFEIVPIQNMPTAVETVETTATVKGIYTIMGQYVGEDFESLPAGVYVVDGVKIVK